MIKWPVKLYVRFFTFFLRFFQNPKKHDFLRFFELLHTFSRTMIVTWVVEWTSHFSRLAVQSQLKTSMQKPNMSEKYGVGKTRLKKVASGARTDYVT